MPSETSILVIDHDLTSLSDLERTLQKEQYTVYTAQRALDGLDIARRLRPDLILTEINLPDMNGFELAATLRTELPFSKIPVVAISDVSAMTLRDRAFAAGMNGYIDKPINLDALSLHLEFFLSGGTDGIDDTQRMSVARDRLLKEVVKRLELQVRELEENNRKLRELDAVKDKFIGLAAHELRTPLTLLTGYHKLLEDHEPLVDLVRHDESTQQLVAGLNEAVERMQSVIEEVLAFSRIMTNDITLEIRPTRLASLVENVLQRFAGAIHERGIVVHYDPDQWPDDMRADGTLLELTLENLISNAIKATPNGGHIYLLAKTRNGQVRIIIRDTGVGIPPQEQENIFDRMHIIGDIGLHSTSKTAFGGGGLGLGLAICRGIVNAHVGDIRVKSPVFDSADYPGTEFVITMPLTPPDSGLPTHESSIRRIAARNA